MENNQEREIPTISLCFYRSSCRLLPNQAVQFRIRSQPYAWMHYFGLLIILFLLMILVVVIVRGEMSISFHAFLKK